MAVHKVVAMQSFNARPEAVYAAFLDGDMAAQFLFKTPTGTMIQAAIDPRVGGIYKLTERRDGEDVLHTGEYLELERPRRIVFTFSVPKYSDAVSTVTIEIEPRETGCELTLTNTGVPAEWAEQTREGWAKILVTLDQALG